MPPKAPNTLTAPRLPPLPHIKVRRANSFEKNPCINAMSAVLSCWASTGHSLQACEALETQLRRCMDAPRALNTKRNTVNYHLSRFGPAMAGPSKKKK